MSGVDDLLFEWSLSEEIGWARSINQHEAAALLEALYDARLQLAEHPRRCDADDPSGAYTCDLLPGHPAVHVDAAGVEWRAAAGSSAENNECG